MVANVLFVWSVLPLIKICSPLLMACGQTCRFGFLIGQAIILQFGGILSRPCSTLFIKVCVALLSSSLASPASSRHAFGKHTTSIVM